MNEPHGIIDASIDIRFSIHPFLGRIDPCACVLLSGSVFSSSPRRWGLLHYCIFTLPYMSISLQVTANNCHELGTLECMSKQTIGVSGISKSVYAQNGSPPVRRGWPGDTDASDTLSHRVTLTIPSASSLSSSPLPPTPNSLPPTHTMPGRLQYKVPRLPFISPCNSNNPCRQR